MNAVIKNARVLIGDEFVQTNINVENGLISSFGTSDAEGFDASGLYALPGFIDTHIHGAVGDDFSEPDCDFEKSLRWEASQGVTGMLATTDSVPLSALERAFENIGRQMARQVRAGYARVYGAHAEGPFINPLRKGAMNANNIVLPDPDFVRRAMKLSACGGLVLKILSLSPELPGAYECARIMRENGACASIAHTVADYECAADAEKEGFLRATHLFNAMLPLSSRAPGAVGYALRSKAITCELICDYVHIHPAVAAFAINAKGRDRICMISDSGSMSGCGDGEYFINGRKKYVSDGKCTLADGTIAGSCVSLYAGVKNLYASGVSLADISVMASKNPAEAAGVNAGVLKVGKNADIVLLDEKLGVAAVMTGGMLKAY
ncbi:MAG TPA: N-acetylglucosamine-6-phosphate deacetylase [Bacillota bacterium]|nr:N-acetylglucosamine-6-phosphate deacetylase [Bacillota bacterium]